MKRTVKNISALLSLIMALGAVSVGFAGVFAAGTRNINGETYYQFDTDKISPADLGRTTSYTIHTNSGDITLNASPMSYVRRIAGDFEYAPGKLLTIAAYYKYYKSICNLINQGN